MSRRYKYEAFSVVVPEGWSEILDEATFSDPDVSAPVRFAPLDGEGEIIVTTPRVDADDLPGADPDELEALVREWGMRRGINEPLGVSTEVRQGVARAGASYKVGDELCEIWFVCDGTALLRVTYVCPFGDRDLDRGSREALIGSLRFE